MQLIQLVPLLALAALPRVTAPLDDEPDDVDLRGPRPIPNPTDWAALERGLAEHDGTLRVLVRVRAPFAPEGLLDARSAAGQRAEIAAQQQLVLDDLERNAARHLVKARFRSIPHLALQISRDALAVLARDPSVEAVMEDLVLAPALDVSVPAVGAVETANLGFQGGGHAVAILDTGVDSKHPFLAGSVVAEACFADDTLEGCSEGGDCPNHGYQQLGPGSAIPCGDAPNQSNCSHGTHVAGIAAGREMSWTETKADGTKGDTAISSRRSSGSSSSGTPSTSRRST